MLTESQFNTQRDLEERAGQVLAMWTMLQSCKRVSVSLADSANAFLKAFDPGAFDSIESQLVVDAYDGPEGLLRSLAEKINDEARDAGLDESPITTAGLVR